MRPSGGWRSYGAWSAAALAAQAVLALFGLALALRLLPVPDRLVWISGLAVASFATLLDLGYPQRVQRALQVAAVAGVAPADAPWVGAPRAGLAWVGLRLGVCSAIATGCLLWPHAPRAVAVAGTAAALTGLNAARGGFGLVTAALFAEQRFVTERRARLGFIAVQIVVLPAALALTHSAPAAAALWALAATAAAGTAVLLTARLRADAATLRTAGLVREVATDLRRGAREVAEWLGINLPAVGLGSLALPVAIAVLPPTQAAQFAVVAAAFANVLGLTRELFDGARADAARRWFAREAGVRRRVVTLALGSSVVAVAGLAVLLVVNVTIAQVASPDSALIAAYLAMIAVETVQMQVTMVTIATGYVRFGVVTTLSAIAYALIVVPAARAFGAPGIPLSLMVVQIFFVYQYNIRKGLKHLDYR